MKKFFFFAALICAHISWAAAKTVTDPADIPAYYASLDNTSGASLWNNVSSVASRNRGSLGYDGLYNAYIETDSYPADSVGKAGMIWDMYSECGFEHNQKKCGNYSIECDCYNREHSIPKSWFGGSTSGIGCDIFHVVPTDGKVNGMRSAFVYGEVAAGTATYTSNMGHQKGNGAAIYNERKTICANAGTTTACTAGTVFEPVDQYKGDFARGYMGVMASWNANMTQSEGSDFFRSSYTAASNFGLTDYGVALLMKWHREDPVSQKEIDRNNGIQKTQGNRNPFIDYPYLAEYIWGEHAGETVDMSQLIASCESGFVPGQSSGLRDDSITPPDPQPVIKHGVTWSINGEEQKVDSIKENNKVTSLPAEPTSCSTQSTEFIGWTTAPISGSQDDAPAVLYKAAKDIPAITADITLYAVFAHAQTTQTAAPATYTFDADHQSGWTNTGAKTNSYWLLDAGKSLVSPEIDLSGLSSIEVRMRTYGGTSYNQLVVEAGSTAITTILATSGKTMTDYTWTNTASLSGTSALTFTCGNAEANKGIGFESVTINATGGNTTYSRFITSCQTTTELTEAPAENVVARKVLIGGHIYLQIGDALYTVAGQRIK